MPKRQPNPAGAFARRARPCGRGDGGRDAAWFDHVDLLRQR